MQEFTEDEKQYSEKKKKITEEKGQYKEQDSKRQKTTIDVAFILEDHSLQESMKLEKCC